MQTIGVPVVFDTYNGYETRFSNGYDDSYALQNEPVAEVNGAAADKFTVMAEALAWVFRYCWVGHRECTRAPRDAFRRFVAIAMTVRPDMFGDMSFTGMSRKLRLSKATLSKLSLDFSDKAGLHFRRNRRDGARRKFSQVQKTIWKEGRRG